MFSYRKPKMTNSTHHEIYNAFKKCDEQWIQRRRKIDTSSLFYTLTKCCLFAAFLSHGQELNFTQADLPKLRERLNWSILNFKLKIDGYRRKESGDRTEKVGAK